MSNRAKKLLRLACNNVNVNNNRLKPAVRRHLNKTFRNIHTYNNEDDGFLKNYLLQWVNKSDPSYGLSDNDDVLITEKHIEENVTSCAIDNKNIENFITLNNVNYSLEFSNDDQHMINNGKIGSQPSVILGTPESYFEKIPMDQDHDVTDGKPTVILSTAEPSLVVSHEE